MLGVVGGVRLALHTKLFPSLLSCEEAFFSIVDSLVHVNFWGGGKPFTPNLPWYNYETNILNIFLLEKSLRTKIYPCGGKCKYIDVSSGEALPCPAFGTHRHLCAD